MPYMRIAKITLRALSIILNILAGLALVLGLLSAVWSLVWGSPKSALISLAVGILPLLVVLANKIYPSDKKLCLKVILDAAFVSACVVSVTSFLFSNAALGALCFYFALVILGVVLLRAAARLIRGLRSASPAIRQRCTLLSVVATLLIMIPPAYFEIRSRQEFDTVWQAIDQVSQKLVPYGAVEHVDDGRLPYYRKGGIINAAMDCNYVHPCPAGTREWYVLTDNSRYKTGQMVASIFSSLGIIGKNVELFAPPSVYKDTN
jgi:hypothetical protein